MTNSVNPKIDQVAGLFKDLLWDTIVEIELAALFAEAPYLAIFPIKQVISGIVHMASDRIFAGLKLAVDLQAVTIMNEQHKKAFDKSAVALKIIAYSKGIDSPEFKEAKENAKKHLATFVRTNC